MAKVLISGGSGMVGQHLIPMLLEAGYTVHNLSRSGKAPAGSHGFRWNYRTGFMDEEALEGVEYILHFAGAGVANQMWTRKRKRELVDSRIKTGELLVQACLDGKVRPKQFLSASGIAYYGYEPQDKVFSEKDVSGPGFLGELTQRWEALTDPLEADDLAITKLRIGMVLGPQGALPKLAMPVKWGMGSAMGTGRQSISWIHVHDLCRMIMFCLQEEKSGVFNAVAPDIQTQRSFIKAIAKETNRPMWAPPIPSFLLKMVMGRMADEMLLGGIQVSGEKIQEEGFTYSFPTLDSTLANLL